MTKSRNIKKLTAAILAGILTAGLGASVLAAPGPAENRGQGGSFGNEMMPPAQGEDLEGGERPEFPAFEEGERPQFEEGKQPEAETGELPEDADLQTPPFEQGRRADGAQGERPEGREGRPGQDGKMGPRGNLINVEEIAEAISSVEDEETQTTLSDLLAAYQEALDAQKEALDSQSDEGESADIESLRTAVMEAGDELLSALEEAGIGIELPKPPAAPEGERPELSEDDQTECPELEDAASRAGRDREAGLEDQTDNGGGSESGSTENNKGKTGVFSKIKNAVSNFFGKFKK